VIQLGIMSLPAPARTLLPGSPSSRSLPLLCTAGQPASAAQLLLGHLCQAGCRLRYHGDLDTPGIAIANLLIRRFAMEPWRMSAADYVSCVSLDGPPLRARIFEAVWDDQLSREMRSCGPFWKRVFWTR